MLSQAWSILSLLHPFLTVTPIEAVDNSKLMALSFVSGLSVAPLRAVGDSKIPQPTIIKKSSLSHRIAIQQHGMRGSTISILPADEMGYFCISQAYTRSLGHTS